MINILVLEDNISDQRIIRDALLNGFGNLISIYPKIFNSVEQPADDLDYSTNVISLILRREFEKVIEFYKDIDLFIIDVSLSDKLDIKGIEFLDVIRAKYPPKKFEAIVISNVNDSVKYIDENLFPFISKMDYGLEGQFSVVLIEKIKNAFGLNKFEGAAVSNREYFVNYLKEHRIKYVFNAIWLSFKRNIQRTIDKLVLVLFYLLMGFTIVYGGYNIVKEIISSFWNKSNEDTGILSVAEHIFLYLLPIFIVFGFFNYYKTNTRISLLDGNPKSIDHDASTKTMNLTKMLFVSSIISYAIIKTSEELFIHKTANIVQLSSYGVLLILLMSYFVFLDKNKH